VDPTLACRTLHQQVARAVLALAITVSTDVSRPAEGEPPVELAGFA